MCSARADRVRVRGMRSSFHKSETPAFVRFHDLRITHLQAAFAAGCAISSMRRWVALALFLKI
jgi:hypothetical protein